MIAPAAPTEYVSFRRILILDRDPELASALGEGLKLYGYVVLATSCPNIIIEEIQADDILICDYSLPFMSGLDVARLAYARGWRGPLLLLSGHTSELKKCPGHPLLLAVLKKPYSTQELLQNLRAATFSAPLNGSSSP